jgi:hypothetical protein
MDVNELALRDDFTISNALLHNGRRPVEAKASFTMEWFNPKRRFKVRDVDNDFGGRFVKTNASIVWRAEEKGFKFVSRPANRSNSVFAILGHERNGVFFPIKG